MKTLYYGDNLKILRDYIKDESVDLIYVSPQTGGNTTRGPREGIPSGVVGVRPFNSNRNYNVLFKDESGTEANSRINQ